MRIAISGTHSLGKSTFVNDFHQKHSDYILETEPFRALRDNHIIHFAEKATQLCNLLQIDHCIERSKLYHKNDNVIFDRCAADYLPYSEYPEKFGDTDIDKLFIKQAYVGKSLRMKRWRPRAKGRAASIIKPFSKLTIVVEERVNSKEDK